MEALDLAPTMDGGYLLAGFYSPSLDPTSTDVDGLFLKVDANGQEIWRRTYGDPGEVERLLALTADRDGGFVAFGDAHGSFASSGGKILLMKIDASGELVWQTKTDLHSHIMPADIYQDTGGGYVLTGSLYGDGSFRLFLGRMNSLGNPGSGEPPG